MRTKVLLGLAVALMLVVSVATIGSNMGFKISIHLTAGDSNFVSLPYYNSYLKAADVFADIPSAGSVQKFDNTNGTFITNTGSTTRNNFDITPGEAYVVTVGSTVDWVVVGSHNPTLALPLNAGDSIFISVPYHTTATDAATLFAQIPNCGSVQTFDNTNGTFITNTGSATRNNFPLVPGVGYVATVGTSGTWSPAHY